MKVCLYVDEYSTWTDNDIAESEGLEGGGAELEYRELEAMVVQAFPGIDIRFERDVRPHQLKNSVFDFYIFDIGGLSSTDFNGVMRGVFCDYVLRSLLQDMPSSGFVPWSRMTRASVRQALEDFVLGSNAEEIPDGFKLPEYPNLFLPSKACDDFDFDNKKETVEWMKKFRS